MSKPTASLTAWAIALVATLAATTAWGTDRTHGSAPAGTRYVVNSGVLAIEFDREVLESLVWRITPAGDLERAPSNDWFTCAVEATSRLSTHAAKERFGAILSSTLQTRGALLLDTPGMLTPVGYLGLKLGDDDIWQVTSTLHNGPADLMPFELSSLLVDFKQKPLELQVSGELIVTEPWATHLGTPRAAGVVIGTLELDALLEFEGVAAGDDEPPVRVKRAGRGRRGIGETGPDLMIGDLQSVRRWSPREGDITAYSLGTAICNLGDQWVNWLGNSVDHPVLAQNIYRLRMGRFEQIGMSWARHTIFPGNGTLCSGSGGCTIDLSGRHLGVGCSDIHSSELNGGQSTLGPRSQINAATGVIEWPFSAPPLELAVDRRAQVHGADLDPAVNADALYFIEGHFIAADDAAAGNDLNNASHRQARVVATSPGVYRIDTAGRTQRGEPAILAWENVDPAVNIEHVDVPGDGRFILAHKVAGLGEGMWHYEYALHNFNSDRSGQRFSVPVPPGVTISNVSFHDVDYHSGSPHSTTDWIAATENESVMWSTDLYDEDSPYSNALGWGTLYNFRFDADTCPVPGGVELGLYKPGDPSSMSIGAEVPGPAISLVASDPPSGAIDARQPFDTDPSDTSGWRSINMTFSACASAITKSQFTVTQQGVGSVPTVERVDSIDESTITVVLSDPISVGAWTTITHMPSATSTTLGYLPADVDGDGTCATRDLITLIDAVSNEDDSLPLYSMDIDRSQEVDLGDIIRLIDLLTGTGPYEPYMSATLP